LRRVPGEPLAVANDFQIHRRLGLALAPLVWGAAASATDKFEIQVYEAEVNAPLQPGIELHANYTISGQKEPAYEGEIPAHGALRLTLEPALGITEWLELGA